MRRIEGRPRIHGRPRLLRQRGRRLRVRRRAVKDQAYKRTYERTNERTNVRECHKPRTNRHRFQHRRDKNSIEREPPTGQKNAAGGMAVNIESKPTGRTAEGTEHTVHRRAGDKGKAGKRTEHMVKTQLCSTGFQVISIHFLLLRVAVAVSFRAGRIRPSRPGPCTHGVQ